MQNNRTLTQCDCSIMTAGDNKNSQMMKCLRIKPPYKVLLLPRQKKAPIRSHGTPIGTYIPRLRAVSSLGILMHPLSDDYLNSRTTTYIPVRIAKSQAPGTAIDAYPEPHRPVGQESLAHRTMPTLWEPHSWLMLALACKVRLPPAKVCAALQ